MPRHLISDAHEWINGLRARGFSAAAINGDLVQTQRERTIGQLRNGDLDILVATDVAARGLDVERISHVVNFDIPQDAESYVHRIGRTGRAGRSGEALLFVTPRERGLLRAIEKTTRQPITEMALPTVEDVNVRRVARFADSITERLGAPDIALYRGLVEDYEREHNIPMADIAAVLAILAQDDRALLLEPDPPKVKRERVDRADRPERADRSGSVDPAGRTDRDGRSTRTDRPDRPTKRRAGQLMATYRIRVGRRHKVQPGSIVGALANEGGLSRGDFGHIDIRGDHSLVELPADLSQDVFDRLRHTRVSGQLIELARDAGQTGPETAAPAGTDLVASERGATRPARGDRLGAKPERVGRASRLAKGHHSDSPERAGSRDTPGRGGAGGKPAKKAHRKGQAGPR